MTATETKADTKFIGLDAVIGEVVRRYREDGIPIAESVTELVPDDVKLSTDEEIEVIQEGLRSFCNMRVHKINNGGNGSRFGNIGGTIGQAIESALERVHRIGADGKAKPIIEFDIHDLDHLINTAVVQIAGFEAQKTWAETARYALKKHKKRTISELPKAVQLELEEAAEGVW